MRLSYTLEPTVAQSLLDVNTGLRRSGMHARRIERGPPDA
jgi:hypothetical protein